MRLYDHYVLNAGNSIIKSAHYFPIYERYFGRFVGHPLLMFEIGTGRGGSSIMWKRYFGPMARIVTIDIADCAFVAQPQIFPRRGSQSDAGFLSALLDEFGAPDIVLDDGSHRMSDIAASFEVLFAPTKGVYLVEDLDGAYWAERGGGLGAPGSFVETAKALIDHMNALYVEDPTYSATAARDIISVGFYQMMVVIEKSPYLNREMLSLPAARGSGEHRQA